MPPWGVRDARRRGAAEPVFQIIVETIDVEVDGIVHALLACR
jgi:hypothetical protein